jgi:hypothetical protein
MKKGLAIAALLVALSAAYISAAQAQCRVFFTDRGYSGLGAGVEYGGLFLGRPLTIYGYPGYVGCGYQLWVW